MLSLAKFLSGFPPADPQEWFTVLLQLIKEVKKEKEKKNTLRNIHKPLLHKATVIQIPHALSICALCGTWQRG